MFVTSWSNPCIIQHLLRHLAFNLIVLICLCVILLGHMKRGTDRQTDKHILIFLVLITINFVMITNTGLELMTFDLRFSCMYTLSPVYNLFLTDNICHHYG